MWKSRKRPKEPPKESQAPAYERLMQCFHEAAAIREEILALPFLDESLKRKITKE